MSTPATDTQKTCVVLLSDCDGVLTESVADDIEKRLKVSADGELTICRPASGPLLSEEVQRLVQRVSANRVLVAGCSAGTARSLMVAICQACEMPAAHVRHIGIHALKRDTAAESALSDQSALSPDENTVGAATRQILRGVRALGSIGDIETVEIPLNHDVVVLGDDECARRAATEVSRFGFQTTMIATTELKTGDDEFSLLSGATETETRGCAGSFEVEVKTGTNGSSKSVVVPCGAIIDARVPVASESKVSDLGALFPGQTDSDQIFYLESLVTEVSALPRTPRERTIAIVLDLNTDETKASTAQACEAAIAVQQDGAFQVHLLCRHIRVASPEISRLYDKAREAGVAILKYDKRPTFSRASERNAVEIQCTDTVLGARVSLLCDMVAVSRHGLANLLSEAYVNNLHFSPANSSIPGYFLAGAATGQHYAPEAMSESITAAIEVRKLLTPAKLEIELSSAIVDEEKCAICLTCIRTCPHLAMRIDSEKNIAKNIPQSCQRCGICVGVCPAKAISLPEYSEEVVFALLD